MADSIIVGQFVGSSALAAVGACAALTNVFICVALGAGVGAGVLVSRYFGAGDYGQNENNCVNIVGQFSDFKSVSGWLWFLFSHSMMNLLQTPTDILEEAVQYLRIYFAGFPFLFMYNIFSTMFLFGRIKNTIGSFDIFFDVKYIDGSLDGSWTWTRCVRCSPRNSHCTGISAVFSFVIFFCRLRQYKVHFTGLTARNYIRCSNCHTVSSPAVYSVNRYDDRTGSCESIRYTGTRRLCCNDESRECFFVDICVHW